MRTPEFYRDRAAHLLAKAEQIANPEERRSCRVMAAAFKVRARRAELEVHPGAAFTTGPRLPALDERY